ncbi:MAG TPA: substrate-binding domain-containing protein [Atopostipes sp.]|nr:substrate-binding domain-containing protein [Atopostipes sp.]
MFKSMKKGLLFFMLVLVIGVLAACGGDDTSSGDGDEGDGADAAESGDKKVEIVAKGFQHDFWVAVKDGAEEAAEEHGVSINFVGPKNESAISEQVEMITNAVNKDPDAIALAALDTSAALGAIEQAMDKSIPIIGFDSGVPDAPEGAIAANASTDNYAAGELAAEETYPAIEDQIKDADGDIRIGVLAQEVNSMSITERTVGFIDKMVELVDGELGEGSAAVFGHEKLANDVSEDDAAVLIETRVPAEVSDSAGQTEAQTLLNKDDLVAIYGSNEFAAKSIINADNAISGGKIGPDKVVAVGFDSGALQIDAIVEERFYGSVTQDPIAIGFNAVELAVKASDGEDVSDVDTGAKWYNADNIEDDDIQAIIYE